jgi:hypothetical protein
MAAFKCMVAVEQLKCFASGSNSSRHRHKLVMEQDCRIFLLCCRGRWVQAVASVLRG